MAFVPKVSRYKVRGYNGGNYFVQAYVKKSDALKVAAGLRDSEVMDLETHKYVGGTSDLIKKIIASY